ncbi:zf-TFIIB domain-containing protein [Mycobacterium sp. 1245111.1]|uniref:TFIIB-type zinc ribbon-containing protein n=1 Tax=Mycobacterium sp. 1245111.1 TaxID=1834073 RepID=UPI0009F61954|nr:zf-TFIIB domain-containing protein [Mycobacterium sp. 1245111.1]
MSVSDHTRPEPKAPIACPKCVAQMLPVHRFGVEIDQCTGCGGIFLDRGELEVLAQAEANFYGSGPQPAPPQQYSAQPQQYMPPQHYPQQRGGFLGGLFGGGYHGRYEHH